MEYGSHYSVLCGEIIETLKEHFSDRDRLSIADLTFGGGGHSKAILDALPQAYLKSFDQDLEAINNGKKWTAEHPRIELIHSNFENISDYCEKESLDAVIMDLGVSSHQFDEGGRGFSFRFDASLDMRMNSGADIETAKDIVNNWSQEDIEEIIREYGEDRFAKRIAENIVHDRQSSPIETTKDLENIIFHCYPKKMRHEGIHPATRTFQALRIAVNRELEVLGNVLVSSLPLLKMDGIIGAISFHSLEDRIVKRKFKEFAASDTPCEILTKKPLLPSEKELADNSRSRSAKLRLIKRVSERKSKNKYAKQSRIGGTNGEGNSKN